MIEKNDTEKKFGDFIVRELKVTHTTVSQRVLFLLTPW